MRKTTAAGLCAAVLVVGSARSTVATEGVRVSDDGTLVTVTTADYRAILSRKKGFTPHSLVDVRTKRTLNVQQAGLVVVEERERETWTRSRFGKPVIHNESQADATVSIEQGEDAVVCASQWRCDAAEVRRTLTFRSDTPVIEMQYAVRVLRPLEQIGCYLTVRDVALSRKGRFYPDARRFVVREPSEALFEPAPGYAYCHDGSAGIGLLCPPRYESVDTLAWYFSPPGVNQTHLAFYTPPLRWRELPFELTFGASIVVGSNPDAVAALYRSDNPDLKPVEIAHLTVEKLLHRTSEPGRATVVLRNNTGSPQTVVLSATIMGGIASAQSLPDRTEIVPPYADLPVTVAWDHKGKWGFELSASIRDGDGTELDTAREYFGVTDHFVNMGQTTVWNAGWMRYEWLTPAMVEHAQRCYVGALEFYCWAPDQVFDLTPDTETFEPHTESQGSYRTELTRTFVRNFVDAAHRRGLYVMAMDTGFASLDGALAHPERMKYTEDGQIYLYNGNFHDGKRFHAVGAHVYTPEVVRAWAEEMNASVELFGWDGVRFDWNFIPIAVNDPRLIADARKKDDVYGAARMTSWYTIDGVSAHDLFPEPDKAAAEFCRIWRSTVAGKHPEFIYGNNYSVHKGLFDEFPEYSRVSCEDAGIQIEGLLNISTLNTTWQAWATALTDGLRPLRAVRAQPFVGWMAGYAPGGIAHRNLHYIMMASGFRWNGPYGPRHSIDGTAERFRHALRFAEFFYDTDFVPQEDPESLVSVAGPGVDRVLWKPFVFERRRGSVREILVHMLNLPPDDYILMRHTPPEPKRNLMVTVHGGASAQPTECQLLVPDPAPLAETLTVEPGNADDLVIKIPELRSLGSMLLRLETE